MRQEKVVEEIKTRIFYVHYIPPPQNLAVYANMGKRNDTARETTDVNTCIIRRREDEICMRDSLGKNTDTPS
jgi:hypothetical protein